MENAINIKPEGMNEKLMNNLEKEGLIIRICSRNYFS